jgi:hypothetical protein
MRRDHVPNTVLQYKFKQLVDQLAGDEGAALFEVSSELGPGFFVLIAYTISGGLVHYFFSHAVSDYYGLDPHYQVDAIWTMLLGPALVDKVAAATKAIIVLSAEPTSDETTHWSIAEEDVI